MSHDNNDRRPNGLVLVAAVLVLAACTPKIISPIIATAQVGQPFHYQIAAKHNPTSFSANVPPPAGLAVNPATGVITGTPADAGTFAIQLGAKNSHGEGTAQLSLSVSPAGGGGGTPTPPPFHDVVTEKELFITAPAVVGSERATTVGGAWHFRGAMQRLAGAGADVDAFAQAWFATWTTNTALPGITDPDLTRRPSITATLQAAWANNRFKLLAIVNRLDLTRFPGGDITQAPVALGEGRFIYEVQGPGNSRLPFTIILEFGLPKASPDLKAEAKRWAKQWHALGRPELGDKNSFPEAYLAELQAITDEYSATGNLNQLRTNEISEGPWQLREFHVQGTPNRLVEVQVVNTPAFVHDNKPALTNFINSQEADILAGNAESMPAALQAAVAMIPSPAFKWRAPSVNSDRARFVVSFNSCSGCHAGDTGTPFQHIGVSLGSKLSDFLTKEIELAHPLPGRLDATHNEMEDRSIMLAALAQDVSPVSASRFTPNELNAILKSRANRPH